MDCRNSFICDTGGAISQGKHTCVCECVRVRVSVCMFVSVCVGVSESALRLYVSLYCVCVFVCVYPGQEGVSVCGRTMSLGSPAAALYLTPAPAELRHAGQPVSNTYYIHV